MSAVERHFADIDEVSIHYIKAGKGDPVVSCMASRKPPTNGATSFPILPSATLSSLPTCAGSATHRVLPVDMTRER
jgi:hypothetical protein